MRRTRRHTTDRITTGMASKAVAAFLLLVFIGSGGAIYNNSSPDKELPNGHYIASEDVALPYVGENVHYTGSPYSVINENMPYFTEDERGSREPFEYYSRLDTLGRCGTAYANICTELMPTEKRGPIGHIRPSGWHTVKYNGLVDGNYLYNRCHLIGYQLAGENDNERNLITGTRYFNAVSMLGFENMVSEYVRDTDNHVLYRVTPVYESDNLVATGVEMEAWSVEDGGEGICFNVFCYNIQPGIEIDYATGDSRQE